MRAFADDSFDHVRARTLDEHVAKVQDVLALVILRARCFFLFARCGAKFVLWQSISERAVSAKISRINKLDVGESVLNGVQHSLNLAAR